MLDLVVQTVDLLVDQIVDLLAVLVVDPLVDQRLELLVDQAVDLPVDPRLDLPPALEQQLLERLQLQIELSAPRCIGLGIGLEDHPLYDLNVTSMILDPVRSLMYLLNTSSMSVKESLLGYHVNIEDALFPYRCEID